MKKLILLFALVLGSAMYKVVNAQVGITVNIGNQPVWGPSGYDYAEYYYFPDMDVYYHVPDRQFIYNERGQWLSAYSLPPYYANYDLYNSYKVVINEPRPFLRNDFWHSRYYSYRGRPQENIYNSRDARYFVINEHPEHARWMAGRNNNAVVYNNNRAGNFRRTDDRRYENNQRSENLSENRYEKNQRPDSHYGNNQRPDDRRYDNNQRSYDGNRNSHERNDGVRNDNNARNEGYGNNNVAKNNDNRRWNENNQQGNANGTFNGGRRN